MKLLQRHIFASVLFTCLVAAGMFAFVLIVGNAFRDLLGYMLAGQLTTEAFLKLLTLLVPYVAVHALPIGMLTGVLLVLGRMSAQQEITAMRAAGLGLGFIARPILAIAALGVVASLALNFYYMPKARTLYRTTINESVRLNPLSIIVPRTFIRDFPGVVAYVGEKSGGALKDVWVWRLDKQKRTVEFAHARSGKLVYDAEKNVMNITLFDVFSDHRDPKNPEVFENDDIQPSGDSASFELPMENLFGTQQFHRKLSLLTLGELLAERQRLEKENAPDSERLKISIALHEKASGAFTILAFTIIAIPLGIKASRKETSANLGIALGLALGYYFLNVVMSWLDRQPALHPDWLLWLPPVLFISLGIWMFRRVGRI